MKTSITARFAAACRVLLLTGLAGSSWLVAGHCTAGPAITDPAQGGADYKLQGEYVGEVDADGQPLKLGVQVIAQGKGQFEAVGYVGGLPGAGWNREFPERIKSKEVDGKIVFEGSAADGILKDGKIEVIRDGKSIGSLAKVERKSPTLGQQPPADAEVLFDGKNADQWENGQVTEQGWLKQGTASKPKFQSQKLHIEFMTPFQPEDRDQGRGNSGVYLQGRYEVQVLDSFGLAGKNNEAGGIYEISDPKLNMCFPPLTWQTYDIEFTAAKYDAAGKLVSNPRITVYHNGELVQKDVELPRSTRAAPGEPGPEPGPLYLQDHGNPIHYRNIWVVPMK
ncbi:MAG: DUF1080 domain-containing protein [Pirellulales bacterium]